MKFFANLHDDAKTILGKALSRVYGPSRTDAAEREMNQLIKKIK